MDVESTRYAIARRYMIRLRRDDFDDPHELAKYAATCRMNLQDFRERFEGLIKAEPPPLRMEGMPGGGLGDAIVDGGGSSPAPAEGKPKKKS